MAAFPCIERPFFIVGPTGSGKSAVALALAERWGAEIVNADAYQVYAGLPILTAAPDDAAQQRCPHHLYGYLPVSENYNVRTYATEAGRILADIAGRGRPAIVAGGSGLYVKALTHGLAETPAGDQSLRKALENLSLQERVAWLERLDPVEAARMNLKNPRYVTRALEICLLSGQPSSRYKEQWTQTPATPARGVFLQWDRANLYDRIDTRTRQMIADGALDEVRAIEEPISETASKTIGLKELRAHLAGRCSLAAATAAIQQTTRRYAKRQTTWFRRESAFLPLPVSESDTAEQLAARIAGHFRT